VKNPTEAAVSPWESPQRVVFNIAKEGPMSITSSFRACAVAALAALTVLLAIPLSAHASQDIFLRFNNPATPELQGESTDKALPGAINVKEFSWSIENPVAIGSTSAGAGKAKFESLTIKKLVDASSPGLMAAAGKGTAIPAATLIVRNGDPRQTDAYLQYRLKTVFVTDIEVSAASDDAGVYENVTLTFGSLQQRYVQTKTSGALNPIVNGWDQILNQQLADWTGPVLG
jgi:type VI secretion system secreted protein Hcp